MGELRKKITVDEAVGKVIETIKGTNRMPNRTDLLNHLVEKYRLRRYLEIGVQVPELNFDKILCGVHKIGVDPDPNARATFCMTSDEFFNRWWSDQRWIEDNELLGWNADLIFIDGLHTAEQVKKDFENALNILSPNGFIVLHDCNPLQEEHTIVPRPTARGHWNGDVYKFAVGLEKHCTYTVDIDNGCLVYSNTKGLNDVYYKPYSYLNWDFFNENRKELLNLITWDEFIKL